MKWTFDQSSMPGYLRIETNGKPSPEKLVAMWDELVKSDFWRPGLAVLVDNRKLEKLQDPDAFTSAVVTYFAENADRFGKTCISSISFYPEHFRYARQFQYGVRLRGSDVVLQVFSSENQAVEWLDHYCSLQAAEKTHGLA